MRASLLHAKTAEAAATSSLMSLLDKIAASKAGKPPPVTATAEPLAALFAIAKARTAAVKAQAARPANGGANATFAERVRVAAAPNRPQYSSETDRIAKLGIKDYSSADLTGRYAASWGRITLRQIQSAALAAALDAKTGFLGPIGVGHGKSLIVLLIGAALGVKRAIVFTPARTRSQLERTYDEARKHFKLAPVQILSYGKLSTDRVAEGEPELLDRLTVGLADEEIAIICDEAHKLKNPRSARTKRIVRFMTRCAICGKPASKHKLTEPGAHAHKQRNVRFVAVSGTLTSKSLKDFAHLAELALREATPLPRDLDTLTAWAACLDVDGRPHSSQWEKLRPLYEWYTATPKGLAEVQAAGGTNAGALMALDLDARRAILRRAFQYRLRTAPGVVASTEGALGASLVIEAANVDTPASIDEALEAIDRDDCDPSGEPLPDEVAAWRIKRQVSAGFYYVWNWPKDADNDPIIDQDWLDARRDWNRACRRELNEYSDQGYDSPLLVWNRIQRDLKTGGNLRAIHYAARHWQTQKHKRWGSEPKPPTIPIWINDYLIKDAVEWAQKQRTPTILWYETRAVADRLAALGMRVFRAGEDPLEILKGKPVTCALSYRSHGVGLNMQPWHNQRYIEPPSGGTPWEQSLGRTHRPGQDADEVLASVYQHTESFRAAVATARTDARYIEDSTGNGQKLNIATFIGFNDDLGYGV